MIDRKEHNAAVHAFFEQCEKADPQTYKKVCDAYPVLSNRHIRRIRQQELHTGLLGLEPVRGASRLHSLYGESSSEGYSNE